MGATELLAKQARRVSAGLCHDVPSPCISVCKMSASTELCVGCFRTLDEIALWARMGDDGKRAVWRSIGERIAQHGTPI